MTRYYDLILGSIPLALFGVPSLFHLVGVQFTTAVLLGGLIATGLVGHALFIKAPTDPIPTSPSVNDEQATTTEAAAKTASD